MDIDARLIERWRPRDTRPEVVDTVLDWVRSAGANGAIAVSALFAELEG